MLNSFFNALAGGIVVFKERNFRLHVVAAILILALGGVVGISRAETLILLLLIGVVWSAEAFNTAIEITCDKINPEFDDQIKVIKDVSAFAVLILAFVSVIIGVLMFWPYLV